MLQPVGVGRLMQTEHHQLPPDLTLGEPAGPVQEYIDWILSPEGQKVVSESGYIPVATGQGKQ